MARRNRVTPEGAIIATPARGLFMGNRGCLHDATGQLGIARWRHPHWLICLLSFKGRRRALMQPHRYTELFFLDEAVALAAGHRLCAECRRAAWQRYRTALGAPARTAPEIDRLLHAARVRRDHKQITFQCNIKDVPDGAFIRHEESGDAFLRLGRRLFPYAPDGYGPARACPAQGVVEVLTPAPSVMALRAGYPVVPHPTAAQ